MRTLCLILYLYLSIFLSASAQDTGIPDLPEWLVHHENVKSGLLLVPENHDNPDGREIAIAYAVLQRRNKASEAYPVILFSGGPGESSLDQGLVDFLLKHPFLEERDFILFDQRGIGYSSPLPDMSMDTFLVMAADADPTRERILMDSVIRKYQELCVERNADPRFYNTVQNARDVGVLFKHLGYDKYNLFGGSYGTRLARVVQDNFPAYVHASILDSPSPLSGDFLINRLDSYNLALTRIFEYCDKTPECNQKYPDLRSTYLSAIAGLRENPIKTSINDTIEFAINAQDGIYLLRRLLYMGNAREKAPEMIRALHMGSGEIIQEVLGFEWLLTGALNMSMLLSVEKFENFNPENTASVIAGNYDKYPLIPVTLGYFDAIYQAGRNWHAASMPLNERKFGKSDTPTLIFVNRYDPVTPPENGRLFMEDLSRGHLLILDEGGHGQGNQQCKELVMMDFMATPDSLPDVSCLNLYSE
jgi:pimeloyl-ACP methyl ester carboxylesterase